MDLILLCLLGAVATWGIVDLIRDDDDDDQPSRPEPEDRDRDYTISSEERLETGSTNDTVTAEGRVEEIYLHTGAGNDTVDLVADSSIIRGGPGTDHITLTDSDNSIVHGGPGNDTLIGNNNTSTKLFGGDGDDLIEVTFSNNAEQTSLADGGSGNDTLRAWVDGIERTEDPEAPILIGGEGNDTFEVFLKPQMRTPDSIGGLASHDGVPSLIIKDFNPEEDELIIDPLAEGTDPDLVPHGYRLIENIGEGYTDVVFAYGTPFAGSPTAVGQYDAIRLEGVLGLTPDQITVAGFENMPVLTGTPEADTMTIGPNEQLYTGAGNDTITGNAQNSIIRAGGDSDVVDLDSAFGSEIHGDAGNDHLIVPGSGNFIYGGNGHDTIELDMANDASGVPSGTDNDVYGGNGHDTITGFVGTGSEVHGDGGNDTIILDAVNSEIHGDAGNDYIEITRNMDSQIYGGEGNDTIIGAANDQAIPHAYGFEYYGGNGDDLMQVDLRGDYTDGDIIVDGGAGDDVVQLVVNSSSAHIANISVPQISGGEGIDSFEVDVQARDMVTEAGTVTNRAAMLTITDFNSGVDQLLIDPYATGSATNMTYQGMELRPASSGGGTSVLLRYEVSGIDGIAREQIDEILVNGRITASDIEIGRLPAGGAAA